MKVRLLNDGGYHSLCNIRFPVEVEVTFTIPENEAVYVDISEFRKVPGYMELDESIAAGDYCYRFLEGEWERITSPVRDSVQQAKLLSLIEEYGNPFTGEYRRELLWKEIKSIVQEEVV